MKMKPLFLLAAFIVGSTVASIGTAKVSTSYHCKCTPAKVVIKKILQTEEQCSCYYNYTLVASGTHTFYGFCEGKKLFPDTKIHGKNKHTTCTLGMGGTRSDGTGILMCTNWNPIRKYRDHLSVEVICKYWGYIQEH